MPSNPKTPLILLDGGLGTTLSTPPYSLTFDVSKPLWSSHLLLSPPSLTTLLHAQTAFVNAGAEVILTDTYQASFEGFALSGVSDEGEAGKLMRGGVRVAREAFAGKNREGKEGVVALSLGPYGAVMIPGQEYTGKYDASHQSIEALTSWHLKRLGVFNTDEGQCWGDINMVAFETIPLLVEVEAVREVMTRVEAEEKEFWIACVFPGEGNVLPDGSSVREVVRRMLGGDLKVPMGIGFNCTKITKVEGLIEEFEEAVREMVENGDFVGGWPSLVVYPDGTNGEVYNTTTKTWEKKEVGTELSWDETLFDIVSRAKERGSWKSILVGGCCKTTPVEIGKLRRRIDDENC